MRRVTEEQIKEADFAAYLGSEDEEAGGRDGDDDDAGAGGDEGDDAEALRARYRCVFDCMVREVQLALPLHDRMPVVDIQKGTDYGSQYCVCCLSSPAFQV